MIAGVEPLRVLAVCVTDGQGEPGGVLWEFHDMQAGYFLTGSRLWNKLAGGAWTGLQIGWLVMAFSIPYNILGLVAGFWITKVAFRLSRAN